MGRVSDDCGLAITVNSNNATETGPAVVRYDPEVVVMPDEGKLAVFTVSAEPSDVETAWLKVETTVSYDGAARDGVWRRLRSLNPISATVARQNMGYPDPVVIKRPG